MDTFKIDQNVFGIDLELFDTKNIAAYLLDGPEPILIDTGCASTIDALVEGLREIGVTPRELSHAIISHIHLDHSGGAAALTEIAPDVTLYIHEDSLDFLVDPARLIASSKDAMEEYFELVGESNPVPEEYLEPLADGDIVQSETRDLEIIHTPGHSPDHIAVWEPETGLLFANEGIGSYYPKSDTWLPPATYPAFDIEAARESIARLERLNPDELFLAHYGPLDLDKDPFQIFFDKISEYNERIPQLHERHGSFEDTRAAVRSELVPLEPEYSETLVGFEALFQTKGFLQYNGLLE